MAIFGPYTNAKLLLNAVDLSDHVAELSLEATVADVDTTAMSSTGAKTRTGGLSDGTLSVKFRQDFNTSKVDATLWAAFIAKVPITFSMNPANSTNATTNPNFSGSVLVTNYKPLAGAVGDNLDSSLTLPVSGVVTRTTA